jgi:hypothetical protein
MFIFRSIWVMLSFPVDGNPYSEIKRDCGQTAMTLS